MSLTDRISVRPSNFLYAKNFQILGGNRVASACCLLILLRAMNASGAGRHGWAPMNSANLYGDGGVCSRMCVRAYVGVRA